MFMHLGSTLLKIDFGGFPIFPSRPTARKKHTETTPTQFRCLELWKSVYLWIGDVSAHSNVKFTIALEQSPGKSNPEPLDLRENMNNPTDRVPTLIRHVPRII